MSKRVEERYAQPESGGWFSSVWGLPGRALGWFGRTFGFGGTDPIDMEPTDYPEMQARGLGERESPRPIPQDFIDAFRGTGTRQDFATSGIVEARLCQLAADTDDPEACVEWMAEKFKCIPFHNGNFVNEVICLFKGGELTAEGAAAAVEFYKSRIALFRANEQSFEGTGTRVVKGEFFRFAVLLVALLPSEKTGPAMESLLRAYGESYEINLETADDTYDRELHAILQAIANGLTDAKTNFGDALLEGEFEERAKEIVSTMENMRVKDTDWLRWQLGQAGLFD
ncbi:MAG: hypothetical protein LBF42_03875 [Puniceicoccales bacterium]|jgi:hypothetical protein|nr:hypothetical protein [Puniceicoccales bacterium]